MSASEQHADMLSRVFVQVGPASQPDHRPMPSSMPDPRLAQLDARAASMERRATVAEAENSSLQQQLKSLQGMQTASWIRFWRGIARAWPCCLCTQRQHHMCTGACQLLTGVARIL